MKIARCENANSESFHLTERVSGAAAAVLSSSFEGTECHLVLPLSLIYLTARSWDVNIIYVHFRWFTTWVGSATYADH